MNTPIFDFVRRYAETEGPRFHMPGHKGRSFLGCEAHDITEIFGADTLYSADGIIGESENNLTALYGTGHSFTARAAVRQTPTTLRDLSAAYISTAASCSKSVSSAL